MNPNNPQVSVIIPTFNRATMVCEAVDSVLAQRYTDFEIIVVNDGSTDDTADRLHPYQDYLQLISQSNRGVSAARNTGAARARGCFLAFLDADDLWLPDKLGRQIAFFKANPASL